MYRSNASFQKFSRVVLATLITAVPPISYAAERDLKSFIETLSGLVETTVPIIAALALLYFVWGLTMFIIRSDSEEEQKKGKEMMIWGTITLFVMFSVFGIVQILANTFFGSLSGPDPFTDTPGTFLGE